MENEILAISLSDIELEDSPSFRGTVTLDGKRYIVKKNCAITEHITSQLMRLMGIPSHNTFLAMLERSLVVFCEDFTPGDMEFIPGFRLFEELFPGENIQDIYDVPHLKKVFEKHFEDKTGKELVIFIHKSIFDCIVKEEDFGPGNWGILKGEETRLAPFFDNAETMKQLMQAIDERSYSLEKAMDFALEEYETPFISFRNGHFEAKEGLEDITNEIVEHLKKAYTVESFCSFVKETLSSLSSLNLSRESGMFLYTALVLRYLHVIEGLDESELLEVAGSIPQY